MVRLRNAVRASIAFLWVLGAYFVYSLCIAPWIEPRRQELSYEYFPDGIGRTSADPFIQDVAPLFRSDAWERNHPKVLRSDQLTVLWQQSEILNDGSLQVKPCTVVLFADKHDRSRGPTILQALDGAILAFDKPLNLFKGEFDFGKPVGGRLVGPIRIFSAGVQGESEDLEIVTSDVHITERRLWTRESVSFRFGNNYGRGRGLLLKRNDEDNSDDKANQWLGGLAIVELEKLDRITLPMVGDTLMSSALAEQRPIDNESLSTMELKCDGPLRFDLRALMATADENVVLSRHVGGPRPDTMIADQITLHLTRGNEAQESNSSDRPKRTLGNRQVAVTRVVATGDPHVVIDAPSEGVRVVSRRLDYDYASGRIQLQGFHPLASQRERQQSNHVSLRTLEHYIEAPSIDFQGSEDRATWQMHVTGPGNYRGQVGSEDGTRRGETIEASWQEALILQPQQNQQVLTVIGDTLVRSPELGQISAHQIEMRLKQQEVTAQPSTRSYAQIAMPGVPNQPVDREVETAWNPTFLHAKSTEGRPLVIDSPLAVGTLSNLTLQFKSMPYLAGRGPTMPLVNSPGGSPQSPNGPSQSSPNTRSNQRLTPKSKYRIQGGALTAVVDLKLQALGGLELVGDSTITELLPNASQPGNQLAGNVIHYQIDPSGFPQAKISGHPATVQLSGTTVQGHQIEWRGAENRLLIPGPGTMSLRINNSPLARVIPSDPAGAITNAPGDVVHLDWRGSFDFDGQLAIVKRQVQVHSTELDFRTSDLRMRLARRIDLSDPGVPTNDVQLGGLQSNGDFFLAVRTVDQATRQIESVQQFTARDLRYDHASGNLTAIGAGWITSTMRASAASTIGAAATTPRQNNGNSLSQISLTFAKQLEANVIQREAHLFDRITAWYGSVPDWEIRVMPGDQTLRPEEIRLNSDELFVLETPGAQTLPGTSRRPMELLARGRTIIQSEKYTARGDQMKYSEEKGMVTLEGTPTRPAELSTKAESGGPTGNGGARLIRFWPKTERIEVIGSSGFDATASPSPAPSPNRRSLSRMLQRTIR